MLRLLALLVCTSCAYAYEGAEVITFFGYNDAIELKNEHCRVILTPQVGGKIMHYSWHGVDTLMIDPSESGWRYDPKTFNQDTFVDGGGRFDYGNSRILTDRNIHKLGRWEGVITGPRSALLSSQIHPDNGLQFTRKFELDKNTARLTITQTMTNKSKKKATAFFWGRTFHKGGGIVITPLTPPTFFPKSYTVKTGDQLFFEPPPDKAISKSDDYLIISNQPKAKKIGIETFHGWYAYLMKENIMVLREFEVFPDRPYIDIVGGIFSVYYDKNYRGFDVVELEPNGPRETLEYGQSASFKEVWHLLTYTFPKNRDKVDLERFEKVVSGVISIN